MSALVDNVIAGGGAGVIEIVCMYPTDVIKTRIQLSTGKSESLPTIVRNLISKEGWTALYRGISAPIVSEAPKRAVKFSANEFYRGLFKNSEGKLTPLGYFGAGACAGTTEAFVNCPFEVVKVRMQAPESKELYKSTSHAAKEMLVKEGPTALYKGLEAQIMRNAAWNGLYFSITPTMREWLGGGKLNTFLAGMLAGAVSTMASTPFDVVKSRMQNQKGTSTKYNHAIPSLMTVIQEEGFMSMYKGLGMRLLRLGPGGGIMMIAFEFIQGKLKQFRQG
jgi:solute carrier family 25 2-oxodicarboxylate transporter 21|mmetsp:Transcript_34935/g.58478  ORF Transcript_34935/g.58478 Transcript_34935/m.58478 type:complete len:278 (+) Transcript_34935:48-881(+)|eukprot:CAMPEP_0174294116 /NCGR_PEP_ID=MMETSP0809-20121228/40617_1 /TAXON_ID=73025 ORGANISM="Eutreptiella gymnastica-like, Strain CCMP1594" /NCGR_SAMPLE_ID=MMETSP0809 /ASSEMBLY_ACC=CAM_ASM_000658 /LENGTH=277 /DNA_ID=CAMNT_0015395329 /DNA_START=58 /DNA_END=891 /DNA_ORIENTATION=-